MARSPPYKGARGWHRWTRRSQTIACFPTRAPACRRCARCRDGVVDLHETLELARFLALDQRLHDLVPKTPRSLVVDAQMTHQQGCVSRLVLVAVSKVQGLQPQRHTGSRPATWGGTMNEPVRRNLGAGNHGTTTCRARDSDWLTVAVNELGHGQPALNRFSTAQGWPAGRS